MMRALIPLSQPMPKRKHAAALQLLFYLVFFVSIEWSAWAEGEDIRARGNGVLEGPVIGSPQTPDAMFRRSYIVLPRQRLTFHQRQAGKAVYSLGTKSALCSSLTGPDCLYRPVLANPNDGTILV